MADHNQAQVTLTSLNIPPSAPAKRVLQLNPGQRTIPVGRASKSVSKGLVASADNAWFDSPVMSRNHAEILLHSDNKTLQLQDIGSMHGTILNDEELQLKEPRSLNNGDIVKFGAEVRRGSETFPACSFKIEYQFNPYKAAMASEASEFRQIEDCITDDEDVYNTTGSSSESVLGNASSSSPISKRSKSVEIVESFSGPKGLTEDQVVEDMSSMKKSGPSSAHAGNAEDPVVVESDDEQETDEEMEDEMSDSSGNHSDSDDSDIQSVHLESKPALYFQSESEEDERSGASDDEVRRLSDNKGIKVSNVRTTALSPAIALSPAYVMNSPLNLVDSDSESESESGSGSEADSNQASDHCSMLSPIVLSDIEMMDDSEDDDSADNDSIEYNDSVESVMGDAGVSYQISEAEPESESHEESGADLSSDDESDAGITAALGEASKYEIMEKALASESEKELTTAIANPLPVRPEWNSLFISPPIESPAPQPTPSEDMSGKEARTSFGREPSPSDAAMVKDKTVAAAVGSASNGGPAEIISPICRQSMSSVQRNLSVQSLGEKTGKLAFFQAREENKVKLGGKIEAPEEMNKAPSQGPVLSSIARPKWVPRSIQQTLEPRNSFPPLPLFVDNTRQEIQEQHQRNIEQMIHTQSFQLNQRNEVLRRINAAKVAHSASMARARAASQSLFNISEPVNSVDPRSLSQRQNEFVSATNVFPGSRPFSESLPLSKTSSTPEATYGMAAHYASRAHKDTRNVSEKSTARSSVPISDLVERSETPKEITSQGENSLAQNNKRKADAISDLSDEEVVLEKSKVDVPMTGTDQPTDASVVVLGEEATSTSIPSTRPTPASAVIPNEHAIMHRAKRMKRVAEKVGYAALGGVLGGAAVGAGLFAALVITAPDFL